MCVVRGAGRNASHVGDYEAAAALGRPVESPGSVRDVCISVRINARHGRSRPRRAAPAVRPRGADTPRMAHRRRLVTICCLGWAASIFATSSTVVTPTAFFVWFHENVFRDETVFRRFQLFWGASWFVIVKGWHVTEFALLTLFCIWCNDAFTDHRNVRNVTVAAVLCLIYAASDEWHQTFVPERGGVMSDVMIDALGIALVGAYHYRCRVARCPAQQ